MSAGGVLLYRKLVLEAVTRQPDNAGGYVENWAALGTVWADIRAGFGRERAGAAATLSYVPYRVIVRAAPSGAPSRPRAGQRFSDGARRLLIKAVADFGRDGLYLQCFCKEEVPA